MAETIGEGEMRWKKILDSCGPLKEPRLITYPLDKLGDDFIKLIDQAGNSSEQKEQIKNAFQSGNKGIILR